MKSTIDKIFQLKPVHYGIIFFLVCFVLYGNTLFHDYALDDAIVITKNEFTQQGIEGIPEILSHDSFTGFFGQEKNLVAGGRYRPLSVVMFAVEYELFGKNPFVGHLVNLLLYAVVCFLLFQVIRKVGIQKYTNKKNIVVLAFLTALFFGAHPIHTEVVANIKGRDEILALLFGLLSLQFIINGYKPNNYGKSIAASGLFFLALLSKENAAVFLLLTPATVYLFFDTDVKKIVRFHLPLLVSFTFYIVIRFIILEGQTGTSNELMNDPFLEAMPGEKLGTILFTLGYYLRLLIFPHPLTYDYYPYHIELVSWQSVIPILVFLFYLAIIVLLVATFRKKNVLAYSLLWYLTPLVPVSNIFFPVGVFMGERFIFFSSVGFCILLAYLLTQHFFIKKQRVQLLVMISVAIVFLYGFKTIGRNKAWKNDYTLFTTDVVTSSNSAKANTTAGGIMYEKAITLSDTAVSKDLLLQSKEYLQKAVGIYPAYVDALLLLGNVNWELYHRFDSVWPYYSSILKKSPGHKQTLRNMRAMASQTEKPRPKISILRKLNRLKPADYEVNYLLGSTYGKGLQQIDSAMYFLQQAVKISPRTEALKDLGVAYGMSGEPDKAIPLFEQALAKDSTDRQLYINLGVSHRQLGNLQKARNYFEKAQGDK